MARWICRKCGTPNYLDVVQAAEGVRVFACFACNTKHVLNVRVNVSIHRVQTLEESEREEEVLDEIRRFRTLEVSRDRGVTWQKMKVNVMDTNPETSCLKPGDYIRAPGCTLPLVVILENGRRLGTAELHESVGA
jgi:hypothetical protein